MSSIKVQRRMALMAGALVVYLFLSIGTSITKRPWSDEGWFANAAFNLMTKGFMGTTVLETKGTPLQGMEQHTYWVMPLHLLMQAGWYKLFGFGLLQMRGLSVAWGIVALLAWFVIATHLLEDVRAATLAFALIAFDYVFIMGAPQVATA